MDDRSLSFEKSRDCLVNVVMMMMMMMMITIKMLIINVSISTFINTSF